ncbi:hypothetical protein [Streptomyces vietnamensis]|uniref:hypothetical protein n=1 Tax=Streptomyces vietnamensis TaxID=362257 RepID=UPI00342AF74E
MPLFAEQFFDDHLTLPYPQAAVVGDTYYARPAPDLPLRLRVSFTDTHMRQRYDGLRLEVVHLERGLIDAQWLSFADHGAFATRDKRLGNRPEEGRHATFTDWGHDDVPPWQGIGTAGLRKAIDRYVQLWFPGAEASPAPHRASGPTTHRPSTPSATRSGGRAR